MLEFPTKKYKTIYADPPWPEHGGGKIKRGADRHYQLMSIKDIIALPVASLADPEGAHLYLWATNNYLPAALDCIKAWGFQYVTTITWMKDRIGLGQYFRGITEHCLFAVTPNRLPYKTMDGKRQQGITGFYAPKSGTQPQARRHAGGDRTRLLRSQNRAVCPRSLSGVGCMGKRSARPSGLLAPYNAFLRL